MPDQEELVVDLPETGPEIDVEIDDTESTQNLDASSDEDQEHLDYSKKVQKILL